MNADWPGMRRRMAFGAARFPPPLNYAIGLAAFQAFFLPTGWCYWRAARSSPKDVESVHDLLRRRAEAATAAASDPAGTSTSTSA